MIDESREKARLQRLRNWGGPRPGAFGRKSQKSEIPDGNNSQREKKFSGMPLDYMLKVMRDPKADKARRDRMAIAAAPYCHERVGDKRFDNRVGKKEVAAQAADNPPDIGSSLGMLMARVN